VHRPRIGDRGGLAGVVLGCRTARVSAGFFDEFFTLDAEVQAGLEQELQGYIRQAKNLSRNAGTLLRLANQGLGNPLKTTIATTTKPIDPNAPVTAAAWTGKWTTNYGCCLTTTQNPDGSVDGTWTYTGGGSLVGARVLEDGITLTGRYTTRDFGNGSFTLKETGADSWSGSFPPDPGSPVGPGPWNGSRVP